MAVGGMTSFEPSRPPSPGLEDQHARACERDMRDPELRDLDLEDQRCRLPDGLERFKVDASAPQYSI